MSTGIRVTAEDLETGERSTVVLQPGNYTLICAEPCRLTSEVHHATGTTQLTLKGRRPYLMGSAEVPRERSRGRP